MATVCGSHEAGRTAARPPRPGCAQRALARLIGFTLACATFLFLAAIALDRL